MAVEEFIASATAAITRQMQEAQTLVANGDLKNALHWLRTATRTLDRTLLCIETPCAVDGCRVTKHLVRVNPKGEAGIFMCVSHAHIVG